MDCLNQWSSQVIMTGDISGLVLTGLNSSGIELLQRYINQTGDLQTAALSSAHVLSAKFDPRPRVWLELYRGMLDQWQFWYERARVDMERSSVEGRAVKQQVYARCNCCNNPLSVPLLRHIKSSHLSDASTHTQKISSCPTCNKPLPKCVVCLLPLNCNIAPKPEPSMTNTTPPPVPSAMTPRSSHLKRSQFSVHDLPLGSDKFDNWFTWCQTCRHGGHAKHIIDWFSSHSDCPASDCKCNCMSI